MTDHTPRECKVCGQYHCLAGCVECEPPPIEPELAELTPHTWTIYDIITNSDGSARVEWATNDDDDDGLPDREIARASWNFKSVEEAKRFSGASRTGCSGCEVTVRLDGNKI